MLSSFGVSPDRLAVPATVAPPNKATPTRAKIGPSSTAAASITGNTNPAMFQPSVRMFDTPFDDA
ncbi:hypothetical protein, partial [Burkholderia pseudomallei]|uniref:hypothetical protein n=1 Tax=Burkholderia pseudomallei TaxID=28450 RepID=UPI00159342F4